MGNGPRARVPFGIEPISPPLRQGWDEAMSVDLSAPRKFEVGIPMRDGIELAATVYLPAASELPAPAIVHGSPYDKLLVLDMDNDRRLDGGYAVVHYDSRGRAKSEGEWNPLSMFDAFDGHDVVEWVAAQDWCTGAVGIEGLSYDGWIVMATMSQTPPHLRAAIPVSAAGRWQQEIPYTYGCFQLFFVQWWSSVRRRIYDDITDVPRLLEILPIEAAGDQIKPVGPGWREFMDHETLDELWRSRRWDGEYDFDVPALHITGWHDREDIHGAFHHYEQMMACSPARDRQWLLVGPWSHLCARYPTDVYTGIEYPESALDITAIQLRFFDHFLREEQNGFDGEPRVQIYDPGDRCWQVRPAWKGGTTERRLYLAADEALAEEPGAEGSDSYRYDPMQPNGVPYDRDVLPWEPPLDLSELEEQAGVVSWTGEPLADEVTVRGWGELDMWAATDGEDTEWHVKLADVEPGGRPLWVAWGCLRASFGEDPQSPAALTPGEPRPYTIELTPTFHTFRAGHSFRLLLASSEFPWFARNMNRFEPLSKQADPRVATNTVFFGAPKPSCLRLPVES